MPLIRKRANPELEDDLITAMITSTEFIREVRGMYDKNYFGDYAQSISQWVIRYYDQYNAAPGLNIQNIFNVEKEQLNPALRNIIATYLGKLSNDYESRNDVNIPYLIDCARDYFRRKAYENFFNAGRDLIIAGKDQEAIQLINKFKAISKQIDGWDVPLQKSAIIDHYANMDSNTDVILKYRGVLGNAIGPLERDWLVAFLGPMKRGKSFWLQETAIRAMVNRKNVVYVNLEMTKRGVQNRLYTRLLGTHPDLPKFVQLPVFDCYLNQCNECPIPDLRKNDVTLRSNDVLREKPHWSNPGHGDYRPCTSCRNDPTLRKYYVTDSWFVKYTSESFAESRIVNTADRFIHQFGDRIRIKTYPAYSVTLDQIRIDIDMLERTEKFIPDAVIVDYADVVIPEIKSGDERNNLNQIWKAMKSAAGDMHALWVTASQTTRKAIDAKKTGVKDVAEDIRKLAHVDLMCGISQTEDDKQDMLSRLNVLAHRHKEFTTRQVGVLQQLSLSMPYIDSDYLD